MRHFLPLVFTASLIVVGMTAAAESPPIRSVNLTNVKSRQGGETISVSFVNTTAKWVTIYWIDFEGMRDTRPGAGDKLQPGQSVPLTTTDGAAFVVVDDKGSPVEVHIASKSVTIIQIGKQVPVISVKGEKHPEELKGGKSKAKGATTKISFINNRHQPVYVRWIDPDGKRAPRPAEPLLEGKVLGMITTDGAAFVVTDTDDNGLEFHRADMNAWRVEIGGPIMDYAKPERKYLEIVKEGITMHVEQSLLQLDPAAAEKATDRLVTDVKKALDLYPAHSHGVISSVKLYVLHGPKSPQGGREHGLEYMAKGQPDFIRSLDPRWHHSLVVFSGPKYASLNEARSLKSILHEFAHSYHLSHWCQEQPDIEAAWKQALNKSLYHNLKDSENGQHYPIAYAATNNSEYFAELSACYFFRMFYYPEHRVGLKAYDPEGYRLIEKMWKLDGK